MDGQTATNPQTGEKVILRGGQWVPMGAPAAPEAPSAPGVLYGRPKQPDPMEMERLRLAQDAADRAARGEQRSIEAQNRQMQAAGRLDGARETQLRNAASEVSTLTKSLQGFNPDFMGVGSGIENTAQAYLNVGTPGQRDWWAQFKATDNLIRNELFGASLTAGEKQAYAETTVTPNMSPEQVRQNIARRAEIAQAGLRRYRDYLVKQGYNQDAIDTLVGPALEAIQGPQQPQQQMPADQYDAMIGRMIREGTPPDQIIEAARRAGYTITNPEAVSQAVGAGRANLDTQGPSPDLGRAFKLGVGSVVEGAGDVVGAVTNPINAVLNSTGIPQYLTGQEIGTDLGATLRSALDLPTPQTNQERIIDSATSVGTSALGGAALARGVSAMSNALLPPGGGGGGMTRYVADRLGAAPGLDTAAGAGSGGASETARQQGAGIPGQVAAGVLGGLGAVGAVQGARRLAQPMQQNALSQAAQRQGIDLLPAQTGGSGTRIMTGGARQGFISDIPISKATDRMTGQAEAARNRAGQSLGDAVDVQDGGELIRRAAQVESKRTGEVGSRLYDRAFARAGNTRAALTDAVQVATNWINRLAESPGGSNSTLSNELTKLRDAMANGEYSIQGIRDMRTALRTETEVKGLRGKWSQKAFGEIIDAAAGDIARVLDENGQTDAAAAFRTADAFWKKRVETIDQVLDPLLGKNTPRDGAQIFRTLERMATAETGNANKLRRLMAALPAEEADTVRATVIQRLGQVKAGAQVQDEAQFSLNEFATKWNGMSPKAKAILFTGESRQILNDLAQVANATKQAGRSMNSSNTVGAGLAQAAISGSLAWVVDPMVALSAAGGQFVAGKVLASRRVAQWLARAPKNPSPQQQAAYADRLAVIAAREPAIANEVRALQQRIQESIQNIPQRAAAEDTTANSR